MKTGYYWIWDSLNKKWDIVDYSERMGFEWGFDGKDINTNFHKLQNRFILGDFITFPPNKE